MAKIGTLTKTRIYNGFYEALYKGKPDITAPHFDLQYLGKNIAEGRVDRHPDKPDEWLVRLQIPTDVLSDGLQTFFVMKQGTPDPIDSFAIASGEALDDDLRSEITLLREELDMLKRAFRRHCVETLG